MGWLIVEWYVNRDNGNNEILVNIFGLLRKEFPIVLMCNIRAL